MEKILKNVGPTSKYQFKPFDVFETHEIRNPKYTENINESKQSPNIVAQPAFSGAKQVVSTQNSDVSQQSLAQTSEPQQAQPGQNELIENLLKKIDELSTNMIKMEMQMERQQSDFNARLADERAQAKELGANEAKMQLEASYNASLANSEKMVTSSIKKLSDASLAFEAKINEIEKDLTQTALHLASEVIKQEVSSRSAQIASKLASELLSKLKDASNIIIKVNQNDLDAVKAVLDGNTKLTIEADEAVAKGGVIILSDAGNLDGQLLARFEKIKQEALS